MIVMISQDWTARGQIPGRPGRYGLGQAVKVVCVASIENFRSLNIHLATGEKE